MNDKQNEIKERSQGTIKYFIDAYKAQMESIRKLEEIDNEINRNLSVFRT